jgi:transcriptional regulator with XRE-family HTH domain
MNAMSSGELLRDARRRHGIDQRSLARRAGTTQAQVSRIERGLVSPSVTTLERLFTAMGERVVLDAEPLPGSNRSIEDLRADLQLHPGERVAQAAQLSFALTSIATRA